ncbi:MAG: response regulator [Desulfobacteraceae bacterium]|nr:response regulator [Desulfobacteraceae bacterium]
MLQTPVLIVDDEQSVLEGLEAFLEDEGYEVHLSASGRDAINKFMKVQPELVVMDLRMPGMPGIEVIRRIREINEDTAILIITGYGTLENVVEAVHLNVFDILRKPIDLEQLKAALDRARESMRQTRKAHSELHSMRRQLDVAGRYLEGYQKKVAELESLAFAGRLMAGILHNLNNPLHYISGETQLLQMIYPEIKNLDKIDKQVCRMAKIIRSVLRRLKSSQERCHELLDLNELLEEELVFLESHPFFRDELEKVRSLDADLPLFKGIASDFGQVFGNILCNAAEAMKGRGVLTIRTGQNESEIVIAIQDTGPGIPIELQGRIFEPFFSTKEKEVGMSGGFGTGLGLYTCKQIVQDYGGSIEVISKHGLGATFVIYLPKVRELPPDLP